MTQTTFTDNVLIDGSRDIEQLRVQGHTTQTQPLQTWENSAGTPQARVSGDGNLQIGDDLLGWSTPDALIEAHRADTSTLKPQRGFHSLGQVSGTLNALVQWIVGELELRGSSAINALHTALRIRASNLNTGTPTANAELRGADIEVINDASAGAAALTKATGLQVGVTNASGKTITDAVGVRVKMSNAGTITNPYAIYVEGVGVVHFEDYLEMKRPAAVPGTPATDFMRMYAKSDGKLYAKDWNGNEYDLTGGSGGQFAQTADQTIANTTTETTCFGSGVGALTLPANELVVGKTIRIKLVGRISTSATPGSVTVKLKLGSAVIASRTFTPSANLAGRHLQIEAVITCRSTGVSGTVMGQGLTTIVFLDTTTLGHYMQATSPTTVDTTISQAIDVTWDWGTASASNTVTFTNAEVELLEAA